MICDFFSDRLSGLILLLTAPQKKALGSRALLWSVDERCQTNVISSSTTLPVMVVPGMKLPERIICASGFSIQR